MAFTVFAVLLLMPTPATAAGFWSLERGASNQARGGANVAAPRDPIALYTNPAALADLEGFQLLFDGNWVFDFRTFERDSDVLRDGESPRSYEAATNGWRPWDPSPGVFGSYNLAKLGLDDVTVAAGVFGPQRVDNEWPSDGAQRYSLVTFHPLQIHYSMGVGYELPWYEIRLGVTGMLVDQLIDTSLKLNTFLSYPEEPDYDIMARVRVSDRWIPVATFGMSGNPLPWLILAASYQLPYEVDATGDVDVVLGDDLQGVAEVEGSRVDGNLRMASVLRLAARAHDIRERFDIELAFVWQEWSRNEKIVFQPRDIALSAFGNRIELDEIVINANWKDSYSIHLGGAYEITPGEICLRGGAFYERSAVPNQWLNAFSFDLDKIGASAGARVALTRSVWLDIAAGYVHWLTQQVDDSEVRITNPLQNSLEWPVANGTYRNRQVVVNVGLGLELGP